MLRQKTLVHRTMSLPQNDFGFAEALGALAALQLVRVPHHHVFHRDAAGESGVAAQMLVGKEEDFVVAAEGPVKGALGVR